MDEHQKLKSTDVQEREAAAEALSRMGPDAAHAAIGLVHACADVELVQRWAVAALEELGPPPTDSIGELTKLASSSDSLAAFWAITLLGRAGNVAKSSQGELAIILTESKVTSVRERAAWALGKIHATSPEAIAALKTAENSTDSRLSRLARLALREPQG